MTDMMATYRRTISNGTRSKVPKMVFRELCRLLMKPSETTKGALSICVTIEKL